MATFADDDAILASHEGQTYVSQHLQENLIQFNSIHLWNFDYNFSIFGLYEINSKFVQCRMLSHLNAISSPFIYLLALPARVAERDVYLKHYKTELSNIARNLIVTFSK